MWCNFSKRYFVLSGVNYHDVWQLDVANVSRRRNGRKKGKGINSKIGSLRVLNTGKEMRIE